MYLISYKGKRMNKKPEVIIVGTGAIGGFYGGKLAQSGARVSTVCRSDYEKIAKDGISIKSPLGNFKYMPEQVIKKISDYKGNPDFIIVATKVLPEINIQEIIKEKVHPQTSIILLQNGINIEKPVAEAFPDNEIISALAFICVSRTAPGSVSHMDYGRLVIGKYPKGNSIKAEQIAALLKKSGINCTVEKDIILARWKKLIWNAPFNPISVIGGGISTKTMIETEECLSFVKRIMNEVAILAEKSGHPLPDGTIQNNIEDTLKMKPYKTSMLLDYENKRPMEVEAILGNTVRSAKRMGIDIPNIESIYAMLTLLNNGILDKKP